MPRGSARLSSSGVDSNYRYKIGKKQKRRKSLSPFLMHGPFLTLHTRADQALKPRGQDFVTHICTADARSRRPRGSAHALAREAALAGQPSSANPVRRFLAD
jgi:hypothetical protein